MTDKPQALTTQTVEHLLEGFLSERFPKAWANGDAIKLIELPEEWQLRVITQFGLPPEISRAHTIFLGGRPYPDSDALNELAADRGLTSIKTEMLPTMKCTDLGCSEKRTVGYRAEGHAHETWKGAFLALRDKYPQAKDDFIKAKIYKDVETQPAEEWQRSIQFRASATFLRAGKNAAVPFEVSLIADACSHNSSTVAASALIRLAQRRALNLCYRTGSKLDICSLEELPRLRLDVAGRVVGQEHDETPEGGAVVDVTIDSKFSDAGKKRIEDLTKILRLNRGQLDYLVGQKKGDEKAVIEELEARAAKLSEKPPADKPGDGKQADLGWHV